MLLGSKPIQKAAINRPEFLPYIHFLRGLAILLIVGIHCRTSFHWQENSIVELFFEATLDNGTIIFVFISGFLFEHLFAENFNFLRYFNKKLKYVIGPYLLVSIVPILDKLYVQEQLLWLPDFLVNQPNILKALYMLITGKHFGPYWFIPMIVIFYLISPLLVWMNKPVIYRHAFPLIFIAGLFTYKFGYYSNTFDSFVYFFPIYLFGMWASYYKECLIAKRRVIIFPLLFVYILITVLEVTGYLTMHKVLGFDYASTTYVFNFSKLKVSCICIALLLIFYNLRHKKIPLLEILGDYSFGIYFIHLYFVVAIQFLVHSIVDSFQMTIGFFLLYILVITSLSMLAVHLVKMVFGKKSRYILGS